MGRYKADTIDGFLQNMINALIEDHDPDEDGSSTGEVVSLYEQLKERVRSDIPYTYKRAEYIARKLVEIAPDHGETYDVADLDALAEEVNAWD